MALYNEILVGRLNRALQKLLGMKGNAPAPQVASEFMPVIPFFFGAENRYLESWDRFAGVVNVAAAAGFTGGVRFRNPSGSNTIAVVEKIDIAFSIADTGNSFTRGTATTDLTTIPTVLRMDSRGRPNPTMVLSDQATTATVPTLTSGVAFWGTLILADVMVQLIQNENQEITLLPGDAIQLVAGAVNEGVLCAIWWRERYLEESERA